MLASRGGAWLMQGALEEMAPHGRRGLGIHHDKVGRRHVGSYVLTGRCDGAAHSLGMCKKHYATSVAVRVAPRS